ncbi:MAG: peptidylprolyl isomerase [Planctomycetales bacterium]|nr:peptidylprolyl isomerase [Planctomycetales bacterium]
MAFAGARPAHRPNTLEALEDRRVLAGVADPVLDPIDDLVLLAGSPLHVPLNATDADGQAISFAASSNNLNLATEVISGNRSAVIHIAGFGEMIFELFEQRAPRATNHFIALAESGFYNGRAFDNVIDGFTIGAGGITDDDSGNSPLGQFDDQFHADLQHNRTGVLTTAKGFDDSNDARFLITEGENRDLDFVSTIFGQLVDGEDVRDAISNLATDANDRPLDPPVIESIDIVHDNRNGVLMLKAPEGFTGEAIVTVVATDAHGGTAQHSFQVDIQPDSFDSDPFLVDIPRLETSIDTPVTHQLGFVDLEGDETIFFDDDLLLANGLPLPTPTPADLTYSIDQFTGEMIVTPSNGLVGTYRFWVATGSRLNTFPGEPKEAFIDYQQVEIHIAGPGETTMRVDTSLVSAPSTTTANGDRAELPDSTTWVDEFGEAWLEIWLTSQVASEGVPGASLDVRFDALRFAARQVVFGPTFSGNQAFAIDNALGAVHGVRATANRTDAGETQPVLFARVRLEANLDVVNNAIDHHLKPESTPLFAVHASDTTLFDGATYELPAAQSTAYFPVMYDLDDSGSVGFGDLAIFTGAFLRPVGSDPGTFAADFNHSGRVEFGDLSLFTANFLANRGTAGQLDYANTFPTDWLGDGLQLAPGFTGLQESAAPPFPLEDFASIVVVAQDIWADALPAGSEASLASLSFQIADLPGNLIGLYQSGVISIDRNAAGVGWFVDASPRSANEYSTGAENSDLADADAAARVDLLTTVLHEMGHALGFDHNAVDSIMSDTLAPGVRRLP